VTVVVVVTAAVDEVVAAGAVVTASAAESGLRLSAGLSAQPVNKQADMIPANRYMYFK